MKDLSKYILETICDQSLIIESIKSCPFNFKENENVPKGIYVFSIDKRKCKQMNCLKPYAEDFEKYSEYTKKNFYRGNSSNDNIYIDVFLQEINSKIDKNTYYEVLFVCGDRFFEDVHEYCERYTLTTIENIDKWFGHFLKPKRFKKDYYLDADGDTKVTGHDIDKTIPKNLKNELVTDKDILNSLKIHKFFDKIETYRLRKTLSKLYKTRYK